MAKVNQLAQGFLDLLDAKTGGKNPADFLDNVRPTIDMVPFYGLASMDSESVSSATVTGAGDQLQLEVPANQFWLVYAAGVQILIATLGSETQLTLRTITPSTSSGNIGVPIARTEPQTTVVAGQVVRTGVAFGAPLLLRPGQRFQGIAEIHDDAVPGTIQVTAQFSRFGPASRVLTA